MTFNLIVFVVLALAAAEIDVLSDDGIVNIDILAAVDIDPDVLNDADKLGLGGLLPGPGSPAGKTSPVNFG